MPSLHTQIVSGTRGTRDAQTLKHLPNNGWRRETQNRPDTHHLHHKDTWGPDIHSTANQTVNFQGNYRGVLPVRGVDGTDRFHPRQFREQPMPYQGTLYPKVGYAAHQTKGLAYDPTKPLGRAPMPLSSFYDPGMNSKLGQPSV